MASLRTGTRKGRTTYIQVLYWLTGRQTSTSFHDHASATVFRDLVNQVGRARPLESMAIAVLAAAYGPRVGEVWGVAGRRICVIGVSPALLRCREAALLDGGAVAQVHQHSLDTPVHGVIAGQPQLGEDRIDVLFHGALRQH
jgi:hypothetical protein